MTAMNKQFTNFHALEIGNAISDEAFSILLSFLISMYLSEFGCFILILKLRSPTTKWQQLGEYSTVKPTSIVFE